MAYKIADGPTMRKFKFWIVDNYYYYVTTITILIIIIGIYPIHGSLSFESPSYYKSPALQHRSQYAYFQPPLQLGFRHMN